MKQKKIDKKLKKLKHNSIVPTVRKQTTCSFCHKLNSFRQFLKKNRRVLIFKKQCNKKQILEKNKLFLKNQNRVPYKITDSLQKKQKRVEKAKLHYEGKIKKNKQKTDYWGKNLKRKEKNQKKIKLKSPSTLLFGKKK